MAAGTFTLFSANKDDLRMQDLTGATIKMALVNSTYTPDATYNGHDEWADVSANEIANGNGYLTGGATLANDVITGITSGFKYSCDSPIRWTASGGSIPAWRYAVMYVSGSLWSKTNPVIGYFVGDSTPADIPATTTGNNLDITVPSGGWFDVT
jgi:hypothetical protein